MSEADKSWRQALRPLAGEAPEPWAGAEQRLLGEFRKLHPARRRSWKLLWLGVPAAAAVVWMILTPATPVPPPAPAVTRIAPPDLPVAKVALPVRSPRQHIAARRTEDRGEVATEFFAIPYSRPITPEDRGQVVRVSLPREALAVVGLPVNPVRMFERVQADVVLGEDGTARAVRFVQ